MPPVRDWVQGSAIRTTKHVLRSKTIWGVLFLVLPQLAKLAGLQMEEADVQSIVDSLVTSFGAILAVWGRLTARAPLRVTAAPEPVRKDWSARFPLPLLLLCIALASTLPGCATKTALYNAAGKRKLTIESNAERVDYQGADGDKLTILRLNNSATTLAAGKAAGARINAVAGAVTALGATTLLK